jgi:hypothetical protein
MAEWMYRSTFFLASALVPRWVVTFTPQPLYSQGKTPCYPLDRRLGGLQSHLAMEKILDPTRTQNSDPSVVQPVAVTTLAMLSWLPVLVIDDFITNHETITFYLLISLIKASYFSMIKSSHTTS